MNGLLRNAARGRPGVKAVKAVVAALCVGGVAACGSAVTVTPMPAFAGASHIAAPPSVDPGLPGDCPGLLLAAEVQVRLGLPIDGVVSSGIRGAAAPAVDRQERLTCTYLAVDPAGPVRGPVLTMTAGCYSDAVAARRQRDRNVQDRRPGPAEAGQARLGDAAEVTFESPEGFASMISYGRFTVELVSDRRSAGTDAGAVLDDLARRTLSRLEPGAASCGSG